MIADCQIGTMVDTDPDRVGGSGRQAGFVLTNATWTGRSSQQEMQVAQQPASQCLRSAAGAPSVAAACRARACASRPRCLPCRLLAAPPRQVPASGFEPNATNPLGMDPMLLAATYYASMASETDEDAGGDPGGRPCCCCCCSRCCSRCRCCCCLSLPTVYPGVASPRHRTPSFPTSVVCPVVQPRCPPPRPWAAWSLTSTATTWWIRAHPAVSCRCRCRALPGVAAGAGGAAASCWGW